MTISRLRAALLTSAMLMAAAVPAIHASAAAPSYDGNWSVLVITDSGTCDRGYRYAVRVQNGRVTYTGEAGINISGRVDRRGQVDVEIRRGQQSASGTGRLSEDKGSGQWHGASATDECSGRWQAERRAAN
jgi:hypothetical protein